MSEQTNEPTVELTADERLDVEIAERDAGWAVEGSGTPPAPKAAGEADALLGPEPGEGWNIDKPAEPAEPVAAVETSPTGERTLRPREEDVADAARLGIDYEQTSEFLNSNPGLEQALVSQGVIVAEPKSDAELRANVAAVELVRQRAQGQEAMAQFALDAAVSRYESGEEPPHEIADELREVYGDAVANAFVNRWHADEAEWEDDEPASALDYIGRLTREAQAQAHLNQLRAQQQATQQAQQETQARAQEIESRTGALSKSGHLTPNVAAEMYEIASQGGFQMLGTPAESVDLLMVKARESLKAKHAARIFMEFDQQDTNAGFLPGPNDPPAKTFADYYEAELRKYGQGKTVPVPVPKALVEAQVDEDLFGEERVRAAGWNLDGAAKRMADASRQRSRGKRGFA